MEETENIDSSRIAELISGYLLNSLQAAEVAELEQWINASADHLAIFNEILNAAALDKLGLEYRSIDTSSSLYAAKSKISFETGVPSQATKRYKLWPRIIAAAAVVLVISAGIWFYGARRDAESEGQAELISAAQDILPGKNTATLTLANGKVIQLSDEKTGVIVGHAKLAYSDGSLIDATFSGNEHRVDGKGANSGVQILTAATPRGGTYMVTLPDGTKVWLNAASSISFPSVFTGDSRVVQLKGEGYFEVSKDREHPFLVTTGQQEITVLGTHFNICGYTEEGNIRTTLLEGAVKVSSQFQSAVLRPGQQSTLGARDIKIQEVDTEAVIAWKNGEFQFNNEPLEGVMRKIERWYDIETEYKDPNMRKKQFAGTMTRFANIADVLTMLELTGDVHFKIEGRRVVVTK